MPLRLVRAPTARVLWDACADRFLGRAARSPGPRGHGAHLWLTHASLRDRLLDRAQGDGIEGWLAPPISFLSDLPDRFGIEGRPVGLLTRRRMVARLAAQHGQRLGIAVSARREILRGHMMDGVLGELLPEGVAPERLAQRLEAVAEDDFARRRNEWIASVYRDYLAALAESDQFDPRSVNALLAQAIRDGRLAEALGDARTLHIYGVYSLRSRRSLLTALGQQQEVEVSLYTLREDEPGEWEALAEELGLEVEDLAPMAQGVTLEAKGPRLESEDSPADAAGQPANPPRPETTAPAPHSPAPPIGRTTATPPDQPATAAAAGDSARPTVQPAPDALREYAWIADQVKRRLVLDGIEPQDIAVVARQGREDTRRAMAALEAAGIPCTARIRMPLCDIGALKALLELFRGAASDWAYRPLRNVLTSPYFRTGLDTRGIDFAAGQRRVTGLDDWATALERLADAKEGRGSADADRGLRDLTVHPARLRDDAGRLRELATTLAPLGDARPESAWVDLSIRLITDGILDLRKRASKPVGERWDVVRFDQRGLRQLERLLREWAELDVGDEPLTVAEWHRLLERLLESHELALSTPAQKGVQVLEAHDAALTPFRVVYLTHANDREFPRTTSPGGVLMEEERSALRQAGLPLADRALDLRRERTLWRAATQGDEVTITYRTTDPGGTPLLPSLMVPEHDRSVELPRSFEPLFTEPDQGLDHLTSPEQVRRGGAVRLRRTANGGEGGLGVQPESSSSAETAGSREAADSDGAAGVVEAADLLALQRAILAAYGETRRGVRDPRGGEVTSPNPWHGELRDPWVLERIGERYGAERVWSQSQLEAYATCPFIYLVDRVLRLRGQEEAEEEATPLTFGGVAHDILQEFYDAAKDELPTTFDGRAEALFHRIADDVFRQRIEKGEWVGLPVLWRYTREDIRAKVRAYLEWELEYLADKGERPVWCELKLEDDDGPITLVGSDLAGRQQAIRFTGRIDRVDVTGQGDDAVYHILDYKSSSVPKKGGYGDGTVLQAPLYMEALELLKGVRAGKGRYRVIKSPGKPQNGCQVTSGNEDYEAALRFAFTIPGRIRAGLFEPVLAATMKKWPFYYPGVEVTRGRAVLEDGSRFDGGAHG